VNPYTAPAAAIEPNAIEARAARALYAAVMRGALLLGAVWGFGYGCLVAISHGSVFERFNSINLVPGVMALSLVRAEGPGASLGLTCLASVWVFHRAGPRARAVDRAKHAYVLGVTVMLVAVLATALGLLGSAIALRAVYALPLASFPASVRHLALWSDVAFGLARAAVYAAVVSIVVPTLGPRVGRMKGRVAVKLSSRGRSLSSSTTSRSLRSASSLFRTNGWRSGHECPRRVAGGAVYVT
jgi:hypothetical protein